MIYVHEQNILQMFIIKLKYPRLDATYWLYKRLFDFFELCIAFLEHFFFWQYLNNLETERKYHNWPGSIQDLLRPAFPGMLRHLAKNMFHLVGRDYLDMLVYCYLLHLCVLLSLSLSLSLSLLPPFLFPFLLNFFYSSALNRLRTNGPAYSKFLLPRKNL